MLPRLIFWLSLTALMTVLPSAGLWQATADEDHDAARAAVERGEIRPLTEVLKHVRGKLPGDIVGVEIEQEDGRWLYEFRLVDGKGHLFEAYVDPRNGKIERVEEK